MLYWLAAFFSVFSFYSKIVPGISRIGGVIAVVCIAILAVLPTTRRITLPNGERRIAGIIFLISIAGCALTSVIAAGEKYFRPEEWAMVALFTVMPLMLFRVDNKKMLSVIGKVCVAFALLDVAGNALTLIGVLDLRSGGRFTESGFHTRIAGFTGNILAAGLVAFVAIIYVASLLYGRNIPSKKGLYISVLTLLVANLYLIDSRRYLAAAIVGIAIFLVPFVRRFPLLLTALSVPAVLVPAAFVATARNAGDMLHARLMSIGWQRAQDHYVLGAGPNFILSIELTPDANLIQRAGVTESGILDLWIAFGAVATFAFLLSVFILISAKRPNINFGAVIFALSAAQLSFTCLPFCVFGSILVFSGLIFCLNEQNLTAAGSQMRLPPYKFVRTDIAVK